MTNVTKNFFQEGMACNRQALDLIHEIQSDINSIITWHEETLAQLPAENDNSFRQFLQSSIEKLKQAVNK